MRCIVSHSSDTAFNLAAEEHLFRNFPDDLLFLYSNRPSVVVGKHQNALAEINYPYCKENKIGVFRRISGGGTVFHDLGNLNFSFHQTVDDPSKTSFKAFIAPIVGSVRELGIDAEIGPRNDILVNGLKVSGHAAHVFRKRMLSHGTLLVSSDKAVLSASLSGCGSLFSGKAIASVRSKIANLNDFIEGLDVAAVQKHIVSSFVLSGRVQHTEYLNETDIEAIEKLADEKYRTWEWNIAYSPNYRFSNLAVYEAEQLHFSIDVEKGLIVKATIECNVFAKSDCELVEKLLIGMRHNENDIRTCFENNVSLPIVNYFGAVNLTDQFFYRFS
jgi:lipoate---protein ligase